MRMRRLGFLHSRVSGLFAALFALALVLTLTVSPVFAQTTSPTPAASPTTTGGKCEQRKDDALARLNREKGDVQKRIDDLKARIDKSTNPQEKARLEIELDHEQYHLSQINDRLDWVNKIDCGNGKTCQQHKDDTLAWLNREKGVVQKRIDDLKARIDTTTNPVEKQLLEKELDHAQKHLTHINDRITKVNNITCPTPTPAT